MLSEDNMAPLRVLAVAAEPGSASVLGPVLARLSDRTSALRVLASPRAASGLSRQGISLEIVEDDAPGISHRRIEHEVNAFRPHIVLSTLLGPQETSLDRAACRICAATEVPLVAVLDSWMNLDSRFDRRGTNWECLPTIVAVPDHFTLEEMHAMGFPAERLVVSGHPFFDAIRPQQKATGTTKRVAFISQPISGLIEKGALTNPGYTEIDVAELFFLGAQQVMDKGTDLEVIVREHPRLPSRLVRPTWVGVSDSEDGWTFVQSCDVVVGMSGTLLVYAFLACIPVVCVQPGLTMQPDPNILTRFGVIPNCQDVDSLTSELTRALSSGRHLANSTYAEAARAFRDAFPIGRDNVGNIVALLEKHARK